MRIPNKISLMGHTIGIVWDETMEHEGNELGRAEVNSDRIVLQKPSRTSPLSEDQTAHNFLHEIIHHILSAMGKKELNADEEFVDLFAGLLHQVMKDILEANYERRKKARPKKH